MSNAQESAVTPQPEPLVGLELDDNPYAALLKSHSLKKKALIEKAPIRPLEPISQDLWAKLTGKQKWDSIVALRGPDMVGSGVLKYLTSSIIRYKLSGVMRVGGLVNQSIPFVVLPSERGYDRPRSNFDLGHFLGHIYDAAAILNIPVAYVTWEAYKAVVIGGSEYYDHACFKLLDHLSGDFRETMKIYLTLRGLIPQEAPSCE